MKLTDIYNSIKEEMSDEDIVAILKKQLDPKSTVKVNKPVVKPNVIYTDKISENEMELTPLQQYLYDYEVEISGEDKAEEFLKDIKKLNNIKDIYDYYATERGWLVDKDLKQELKNLINNLKKQNMNEQFKRMQKLAGVINENEEIPFTTSESKQINEESYSPYRMFELIQMYISNYRDGGMGAGAALNKIEDILDEKFDGYDIAFLKGEEDLYENEGNSSKYWVVAKDKRGELYVFNDGYYNTKEEAEEALTNIEVPKIVDANTIKVEAVPTNMNYAMLFNNLSEK